MRKTQTIKISDDGRDNGKVYILREMSASAAEKWAARAFLALARSGAEVPEGFAEQGFAGLVRMGAKGLSYLKFEEAEPLMDEMFTCVSMMPDPNKPDITRGLVEDDIEEVKTRIHLRAEVLNLHWGFSSPGVRLT